MRIATCALLAVVTACAAPRNAADPLDLKMRYLSSEKFVVTGRISAQMDHSEIAHTLGAVTCEGVLRGSVRVVSIQRDVVDGRRGVFMICEDVRAVAELGEIASQLDAELDSHD